MQAKKALQIIAEQCSRRECCSHDVRNKLQKWEIQEKEIEEIMTFLYHHKFIDDTRFSKIYTEDKFRFNHWGKQKIMMMLRNKGIDYDIISEALGTLDKSAYRENCMEILQHKTTTITEEDPYKLKAKLTRFALGRGFDYDTINYCLDKLKIG